MEGWPTGDDSSLARRCRRTRVAAVLAAVCLLVAACASSTTEATDSLSPPSAPGGPPAPAGELPEELQEAVEQTMAEHDVPGAVAGVWVPDEGSWTFAAGLADVEGDIAASTDLVWPLRSVTKSFTVALVLQLVDEGELSLEDTIDQYVDGVTDGDQVTLRQLADMSSGVADYTNEDFIGAFLDDPTRIFTLDELNGFMLGEPAQFAPGAKKVYTNANTNLLGAVIEKVTGQSYADVLQERILDPIGADDTRYITDVATWQQPHPVGYMAEDGVLVAQQENSSILAAAGSMFTTLDDARVWAQTLGAGTLLSPEIHSERELGAPLDSGPPYDVYALGIGSSQGWWGHNGEGIGFTAAVFHDPETGASIAVFMNESNLPDAHPADQTFRRLAEILQRR